MERTLQHQRRLSRRTRFNASQRERQRSGPVSRCRARSSWSALGEREGPGGVLETVNLEVFWVRGKEGSRNSPLLKDVGASWKWDRKIIFAKALVIAIRRASEGTGGWQDLTSAEANTNSLGDQTKRRSFGDWNGTVLQTLLRGVLFSILFPLAHSTSWSLLREPPFPRQYTTCLRERQEWQRGKESRDSSVHSVVVREFRCGDTERR